MRSKRKNQSKTTTFAQRAIAHSKGDAVEKRVYRLPNTASTDQYKKHPIFEHVLYARV